MMTVDNAIRFEGSPCLVRLPGGEDQADIYRWAIRYGRY